MLPGFRRTWIITRKRIDYTLPGSILFMEKENEVAKIGYEVFEAWYHRWRDEGPDGYRIERIIFVREPFPSENELWEFAKNFEQKEFDSPEVHEELSEIRIKHKEICVK